MIKIHLKERLQEQDKSLYWLAKQTGIRYATVWNFSKGKVGRLSIDVLDRICGALDCQPGDLLARVVSSKKKNVRKGVKDGRTNHPKGG